MREQDRGKIKILKRDREIRKAWSRGAQAVKYARVCYILQSFEDYNTFLVIVYKSQTWFQAFHCKTIIRFKKRKQDKALHEPKCKGDIYMKKYKSRTDRK